jgi:hypothetical protein
VKAADEKGMTTSRAREQGNAQKPPGAKKSGGKDAEPEKFYEEIQVKMMVVGRFHNTVLFFDKVARLPRIVTVDEISMEEAKDSKGKGRILSTACTIKTYMFLEKKDEQAKKRPKRSRRFSGVILVCMFLIVLLAAGQGWTGAIFPRSSAQLFLSCAGKTGSFIPFVEKELSRKK